MDKAFKEKVDKAYKSTKSLHGHKKTEEELLIMAEATARRQTIEEEFAISFKDKADNNTAKALLHRYLGEYEITSISDKNNLKELIRLEILQNRIHKTLDNVYDETNGSISVQSLEQIQKINDGIIKLKGSLGLLKGKNDRKNAFDAFTNLKNRWKLWLENNQMSRVRKCPHCQEFIWFKMRTTSWELLKHPFFKDNMIYNKALFEKYYGQTVTVDAQFIADVLGTSTDFPGWVKERVQAQGNKSENTTAITDRVVTEVVGGQSLTEEGPTL